jgi:FMN-dependent NADH-azoreductase
MKILYVNASVRPDSRTKRIAKYLLDRIPAEKKIINLGEEDIRPLNNELLEFRTRLIAEQDFENAIFHYAKDYAEADMIIIVAPYWDLSFPALLKNYIETINVNGLVFKYTDDGKVEGLCKANKLIYITTSGGKIVSDEFGFGYIKELAQNFHGIKDVEYIKAEELDIEGAKVEEILLKAEKKADKILEDINKE